MFLGVGVGQSTDRPLTGLGTPSWRARVRGRVRHHRVLDITWRMTVLLVGSIVLAAGVVMLVTPGPGWLGLILGLAILASEYAWAERLLTRAKAGARAARDRAMDPTLRRRNLLLAAAVVSLLALSGAAYVSIFGWPEIAATAWDQAASWF
ncbi:MAG: TIGR02611 family protein [Nocardioidaceae bacterium]